MTDSTTPAWLVHAWSSFGLTETPGSASTAEILAFYRDAGHAEIRSDEVAWCAAFVGACLERAGQRCTRSLLARSYLDWGEAIEAPRTGAIAVLTRDGDPAFGHVGFLIGASADRVFLLGGNQSDSVSVKTFARSRVLSFRWPSAGALPSPTPQPTVRLPPRPIFDTALAHVLDMEGGYTDDPHDPGGPTNLGITLATFATWRETPVTAENFSALKADLRHLDTKTAAEIYQVRYWGPSRAADMPAALALMHFDTSVNHGVTGAARILQSACNVEVDGEVGPDTIAAANVTPSNDLLDRYAAIRVARYRALPHFWRFGRGWLARVVKTRAAASALAASPYPTEKDKPAMSTDSSEPKWWGNSVAIWGTIITTLSTVLPVIAPIFGIALTADAIQQIGTGLLQLVQVAGGVLGTVMAIYGRARATQPLMRRPLAVRV
jgi:uncharacterized protein (TIGR02594 family)